MNVCLKKMLTSELYRKKTNFAFAAYLLISNNAIFSSIQVASFHNTLGERMIPSTRPMMLQAALDLSSLVQEQKAVYWNDSEQLVNYTDKLKKIVMKLESQVFEAIL